MSDCTTCEGSGIETKATWEQPAEGCEDCQGTGDGEIRHCRQLIEEVDRLFSKSNPRLAREVIDALEARIEERT